MKYLTFLDFPTVEATGASYEAKLKEKDKEIAALKQRDSDNAERIAQIELKTQRLEQITERNEQITEKNMHQFIENLRQERKLLDMMKEIASDKQITNEQKIRYLSSAFENLSNVRAQAQAMLTKETFKDDE